MRKGRARRCRSLEPAPQAWFRAADFTAFRMAVAGGGRFLCRGRPGVPAAARRGKRCFPKERGGTKACAGYGPAWNVRPGCFSPAFSGTVSLPPPSLFFSWAAERFSCVRRSTGRGAGLRAPSGHGGAWAASGRGAEMAFFRGISPYPSCAWAERSPCTAGLRRSRKEKAGNRGLSRRPQGSGPVCSGEKKAPPFRKGGASRYMFLLRYTNWCGSMPYFFTL